jgi:hypothetical protein
MSQSMTTADYVAVIVPCLFFMFLIPLIVNFREERRLRQHRLPAQRRDRARV